MSEMTYAGRPMTREQVRGTLGLLRYYDRFLADGAATCYAPEDFLGCGRGGCRDVMTRPQAARRLAFLIHSAINRKGGLPERRGRKDDPDYRAALARDCRRVRDRVNRRVIVRQFETAEVCRRFGHLLTGREDD
jgi:hypothetical protein